MTAMRQESCDFIVKRGDETVAIVDSLGAAVDTWRPLREKGARILKLHASGWLFAAIIGDAWVRQRGNPRLVRKATVKSVVIGWNRIEPLYRGTRYWDTTAAERASMFPGKVVVTTRNESIRRRGEERDRAKLRDSRVRPRAGQVSSATAKEGT